MGLVLAFLAVTLGAIAWRTDDPQLRWGLGIAAAINALALAVMLAEASPWLLHLMPFDPDDIEPAWRR
jgi:hypothetical protein